MPMHNVVAIPEHDRLPVYYVPNRRVRVTLTGACQYCGGSAFDVEWPNDTLDRPHVATVATVVCLLCTRKVGILRIGGTP